MLFEFIGQNENEHSVTAFGYRFVRGSPVFVSDSRVIFKLSNNSHFKAVENGDCSRDTRQIVEETGSIAVRADSRPRRRKSRRSGV